MAIAMRSASRAKSNSVVPSSAARRPAGAAGFARAVNLQHALPRREIARGSHFLEQRLDVRAEELERAVAVLADQMKVPRVPVGVLEAELAFAEVDLAGDAGVDHPLQRAVDGGAADPLILAADEVDEIVGGEVAFLAEKDVDDQVALARRLLPAGRRLSRNADADCTS